jgi:uncharacterized membrane protein YcgQ (UPF0703/DUF1980 family)
MKVLFALLAVIIIFRVCFSVMPPLSKHSAVLIKDKMFIAQINEIYLNSEDYIGRTIKYEGIFLNENGVNYVIRYGPGCCGDDGNAGFEVVWSGPYPDKNAWVEAAGIIEEYGKDGRQYLRLNLSSLKVLETRGADDPVISY